MVVLEGMTWNHPRGYDPLVATAREYQQTYGQVEIRWEKRSLQAFADHPVADLAERYDLLVIDHPHVGRIAREGCLVALDQVGRDAELAVLAEQSLGQSHASYAYGGHQWGLAIDAAAQVAAWRSDLLEEAPRRWEQVIELAREGKVLWPIKPVDALMSFYTLAANRGTPCAVSGRVLIDQADAAAVLETLGELAGQVPRRCLAMNPIEVLDHMAAADDVAYCPLLYGYSNYARAGFRPRALRFADIAALGVDGPRGSALGGTGIAVSKRCVDRGIAVDYAFWVAGADCQKGTYFASGGQPGNGAAWGDARVNEASGSFFLDTRETLERAYLRPRYDGYMRFQEGGGTLVNAYLAGERSARETAGRLQRLFVETQGGAGPGHDS